MIHMYEDLQSLIMAMLQVIFVFALSPLLIGIMRKVKARIQSRVGSPVIQPYLDLIKLFSKGTTKSSVTSFIFVIAPIVGFVSVVIASLVLPMFSTAPLAAGVIAFAYLFSIGRFLTALSGLDAGSAFGGMGSSREMLYSVLIEPAMFAIILLLATSGALGIAPLAADIPSWLALVTSPMYWLIAAALLIVVMAETGRLPFDNPATHLELTMVHEAMILENSGPDLALIEWAHAAKIFLLFSFMAILLVPGSLQASPFWPVLLLAFTAIIAIIVATIESVIVKVRLFKVSELLTSAVLLALLAFLSNIFASNMAGESWMQAILAMVMLISAIYFIFSLTFRDRIRLYIIQSICLVLILLQISLSDSTGGMNYLFLSAIAIFKILVIPFVLYQSMAFGMKLMPLQFYLRFRGAGKRLMNELDADPIFMNAPITTTRALTYAIVLVVLAFMISSVLGGTTIMLPLTVALILVGMLIIASKAHLLSQLLGFLIMENGVVLLPYALHINLPLLGEVVALFDVVILVRITLMLSFKMKETHGTLDTKKLMELVEKR